MNRAFFCLAVPLLVFSPPSTYAAESGDGTPRIAVQTNGGVWQVLAAKHRFELNPTNLACRVETPGGSWQMRDSAEGDLQVRHGAATMSLRLASAGRKTVAAYENGFQTGLKIELHDFRADTIALDLSLQLFLCFENRGGTLSPP